MKRIAALLLSLLLMLSLVGCVGPFPDSIPDSNSDGGASVSQSTTTTTVEGSTGDTATTTEDAAGTTVNGGAGTTTQKPTTTTTKNNPTTKDNPTTTKTNPTRPYDPTGTTLSLTPEQVTIDNAFALTGSQTLQATISGTVVSVREAYNAGYNNATFTIRVRGGYVGEQDLLCYRCKPAGATEVAVGQTVTVSGTIINYNGTIEFNNTSTYTIKGGTVTTTTTRAPVSGSIDVDGIYDSKEDVGLYIHLYGKLPKNYVTKSQYNKEKNLCVGGDRFYNKEGLLPSGETYYECDIDTYGSTSRGAKRIVYTKSGIVYYTGDHYASFTQLYGAR